VGDLGVRRDLSDVRDVVAAYVLALDRGAGGTVYNVCSGRVYTLREVLESLIALTRLDVEVVSEPERMRAQDLKVLTGTAQALYASTGWQATTPLRQTLEDLLMYWREQLGPGGQSSEPPVKQVV
jgi:GDP-4-dehydro-6-deoxy-D-mannose reductase